jgi:microcystin-dependent protein
MSEPFLAEIRIFPFNFAPRSWAFCNGQLLPISQNSALFSLLGVTYGGNGTTNFALPNLQGNVPLAPGQGPGLTPRELGETGGSEAATLLSTQIPSHTHPLQASPGNAAAGTPVAGASLARARGGIAYTPSSSPTPMSPSVVGATGGSLGHNNMQPYLALNFCIALEGVFPSRP